MEEEQTKGERSQESLINEKEDSLQGEKEWYEPVKNRENIYSDKSYSRPDKEAWEEELTRLDLVITEDKFKMRDTLAQMQETEDEIKLGLTITRADLKRSDDQQMMQEEMINWRVMENRIEESLTKLREHLEEQDSVSRYELKFKQKKRQAEEETKYETPKTVVDAVTQTQNGQTEREKKREKTLLKCYYCHEEGHFERECPQRGKNERRTRTPRFRRYSQNNDEISVGTSMAHGGK